MEKNKISVVLPVYNGEKYVGNAIESILKQTYKNIEIIIVNDSSTDNTMEIIKKYAMNDTRISIYSNEVNQKLPKTLNIGFARATGDFLTWTSDDNRYHPMAFSKMAQILDTREDIDLVYTDFSIVDMNGNLIEEIKEEEPDEIRFKDNIGACFLYRRSLADKVGEYNPDTFLAEDYDFFIRCYKYGRFYHIPENLYDYGRHDGNLSATKKTSIAHQAFRVMNMHFDFLLSKCHTQEEKNRFFYELLNLLKESDERERIRRQYYKLDAEFARIDKRAQRNQSLARIKKSSFKLLQRLILLRKNK